MRRIDLSLFIKHKRNTSWCSNITAALCKRVSDIGSRTVLIIRKGLHDDGGSIGTISFIDSHFIIGSVGIAGRFFDASVNGIVGHVIGFRLGNDIAQLAVIGRIGSAFFHCNSDFSADSGKNLSLRCIIFFFLMFDICKLGMS